MSGEKDRMLDEKDKMTTERLVAYRRKRSERKRKKATAAAAEKQRIAAEERRAPRLVAPDGGWGWVVVLGVSVVNLATRSIEPSFGLLFGDELRELGVETTGASVIMSAYDATINFSGLFVGPLIKIYSYRKVALVGCVLSAVGLILTAPANSMAHILATYSIVGGLGVGFAWSSTFVSLNYYFSKYRGQAIGLSMAGTAVGMMLMPQAVQLLLAEFQFRGAVLVLGGIALHSVAGAALLHDVTVAQVPQDKKKEEVQTALLSAPKIEVTSEADEKLARAVAAVVAAGGTVRPRSQMPRITSLTNMEAARKRKASIISNISSMDFHGSSLHIHTPRHRPLSSVPLESEDEDEDDYITFKPKVETQKNEQNDINKNIKEATKPKVIKATKKRSYWRRVINFMDLDLLKDPIFLNILFGLSIFYVAELNFKMIVPFFLANLGYSKSDTAFYLSMTAVADIFARVVLPPICDRIKVQRRSVFMIATVFLGLARSALAEQTEYAPLMVALVMNGFLRGAALINFNLTISEYCSLEKLPAGFGLHMVGKGIFIVALGPVLGVIRDATGSYPLCIHAQTVCVFLCIIAWGIEYIVVYLHSRTKKNEEPQVAET
ncbi:monocarboxylate transporter 5-like [Schistocerca americana]|uniref:monocarboxylate transporter 5-like n=1 Tax=Schistocerca americana TaxID=7009 RepID=UPI001F4F1730|nr:monocarboxylate transporter 5-like [Schistocerca americana]